MVNADVRSVLLCAAEAWGMAGLAMEGIQTFMNGCLGGVLRVRWPDAIADDRLWEGMSRFLAVEGIGRKR